MKEMLKGSMVCQKCSLIPPPIGSSMEGILHSEVSALLLSFFYPTSERTHAFIRLICFEIRSKADRSVPIDAEMLPEDS